MDKKISVIIPFYPVDEEKHEVLKKCTQSLPPHYETIIVWNRREGMAKAVNEGAKLATGTHLLIMNDDVEYKSGDLELLCLNTTVTSPAYNQTVYPKIWGSCFCVPKKVWDDIGGMDTRYDVSYFDDDDLIASLEQKGYAMQAVPQVIFDHEHPGRTLETLPDRSDFFEANKQKFYQKWGKLP